MANSQPMEGIEVIEIKNKNITRYIGNYDDYREKINKI